MEKQIIGLRWANPKITERECSILLGVNVTFKENPILDFLNGIIK